MLQNAETDLADQARDKSPFFSARSVRSNRRHQHTQGGSLQDLVDSVNSEHLDGDYTLSGQTRRHHQHSRHAKYSSSVSSRQREGGSLPSNVNNPASLACIDTFLLSNYRGGIKKDNYKKDGSKVDGLNSAAHHYHHHHQRNTAFGDPINNNDILANIQTVTAVNANDKNHTIINIGEPDENRHLLAHDSLAQVILSIDFII